MLFLLKYFCYLKKIKFNFDMILPLDEILKKNISLRHIIIFILKRRIILHFIYFLSL